MKQRILILSHDNKIGDAIVVTGLFRPLRAHWPDCEIGILCGPSNAAIYQYHPDVKWLHVSSSRNVFARAWASLKARWVKYDKVVHFGLDLTNSSVQLVLDIVNAKQRFLFLKHPIKSLPNDVVMEGDWGYLPNRKAQHYSARHQKFLQTLGAKVEAYTYDIQLEPRMTSQPVKREGLRMVVNSQSSATNKSLSLPWLENFVHAVYVQHPNMHMQLLSASTSLEIAMRELFYELADRIHVVPFAPTVSTSLATIQNADVVLSPDTYAIHAASAWNKPVIALYEPSVLSVDSWEPLSDTYFQIVAPENHEVSDIDVSHVMHALMHMLTMPNSRERMFLK
jgi:ADP-heptose:LPS heptosyltransferase